MRCAQCSLQLPDTAKFCPRCGAPVAVAVPATERTASAPAPQATPPAMSQPAPQAHLPTSLQPQSVQAKLTPILRQGQAVVSAVENRDYVIAGAGALVALLAFLFLNYVTLSLSGFVSMTNALTGWGAATGSGLAITSASGSPVIFGGMLWLVLVCAFVALAVSGLLAYKSAVIAALTPRAGALVLMVAGGLGILALLWFAISFSHVVSPLGSTAFFTLNTSFGLGFWLSLLGFAAVAVGGYRVRRAEQRQLPNLPGSTHIPPA